MATKAVEEPPLAYFEFLNSETVILRTPKSTCSFRIHKSLLESKCKTLHSAFTNGFSEKAQGNYTCEETSDATLARFIEWAYRGDYAETISNTPVIPESKQQEVAEGEILEQNADSETKIDPAIENNSFLAHLKLYIFCDIYFIPELKQLAYEKLTTHLRAMGKPQSLDTQLAVIAVLHTAFTKLPAHDSLLDWLPHYAAYCIDMLRLQPTFHNLLGVIPALTSRMMSTLNPASVPPWDSQSPKYKISHYEPKTAYEHP